LAAVEEEVRLEIEDVMSEIALEGTRKVRSQVEMARKYVQARRLT